MFPTHNNNSSSMSSYPKPYAVGSYTPEKNAQTSRPSVKSNCIPVSQVLQINYKGIETVDLTDELPIKKAFDLKATPKTPKQDYFMDSIMDDHRDSHSKSLAKFQPKAQISEKFGKSKKIFPDFLFKNFEKGEAKQIKELRQWTKTLEASEIPVKRVQKTNEEGSLKKVKIEDSSEKKKIEGCPIKKFDAAEFVKNQVEKNQEEMRRDQILKEILEKNRKEKEYRNLMNEKIANCEYQESEEAKLRREFESRKMNQDYLRDYFMFILSINLFSKKSGVRTQEIPVKFKNGEDYIISFQSCFFEEVHSEIVSAINQRNMSEYFQISLNVSSEKDCFTYYTFSEPRDCYNFANQLGSDDLILLVPNNTPISIFSKPFCYWDINQTYMLAYAEKPSPEKKNLLKIRNSDFQKFGEISSFYAIIINSCTTMLREFKMIRKSEFLKLSEYIYNPMKLPYVVKYHKLDSKMQALKRLYNEPQIDTIVKECCLNTGIGLIQGPPGTGKTHVIRGILSVLMSEPDKRIVVCAPSNTAIDEIANRVVVEKLFNGCGKIIENINLLRIGKKNSYFDVRNNKKDIREMPPAVKSITLENKVKSALNLPEFLSESQSFKDAQFNLEKVRDMIEKYKKEKNTAKVVELQEQHSKLQKTMFKERFSNINNQKDKIAAAEKKIINTSNIIFTTLSGAGSKELDYLIGNCDFVVIDEACQSLELSSLIPFRLNPSVVIMVGDPNQLPATYFSKHSQKNQYSRSLFERLITGGCSYEILTYQYRMVAEICSFASENFYNNGLKPDESLELRPSPSWLKAKGAFVFDLETSQESRTLTETSLCNESECKFIIDLFEHFQELHGTGMNLGIISPYKKQISTIKEALNRSFENWGLDLEVNTIDGFQGREKDVIIISTVRSGESLGFLADFRRMNVALTRAKFGLWVIGSVKCLKISQDWRKFVEYCETKGKVKRCQDFFEVAEVFTPDSVLHTFKNGFKRTRKVDNFGWEGKPQWKKKKPVQSKSSRNQQKFKPNKKNLNLKTINATPGVPWVGNAGRMYHDIINRK